MEWDSAVQAHFDAKLPWRREWAFHARVRDYDTNATVHKGIWTGPRDLTITLDSLSRTYEGAAEALRMAPISYREGAVAMSQRVSLFVSPEGLDIILGYNTIMAPCDIFCLIYDTRTQTYVGSGRAFKGYIRHTDIVIGAKGEQDIINAELITTAYRGSKVVTGKKSHQSQKKRLSTDTFYKYSGIGTVANDPWGVGDED